MPLLKLDCSYYQQFDADLELTVPAEGYGGWKKAELPIDTEHTAIVIMHAYSTGLPDEHPGWYRAVEYLSRANDISSRIFPQLLSTARQVGLKIFHIAGSGNYYKDLPGYKRVEALSPPAEVSEKISSDPVLEQLRAFRKKNVFVGEHNEADIAAGRLKSDFFPEARPAAAEAITVDSKQLFALCKKEEVNHLIYAGFAINWCLVHSPGGMTDMSRHGILCSAFRQAVTAVENRESARLETHKEEALWRVALQFGFVFDVDNFISACKGFSL